jgi:hypothetical protein
VTFNGEPAAGLRLSLQFWNGTVWAEQAMVTTAGDGSYNFVGAPGLATGQEYYVLYANTTNDPNPGPGYLWNWYANSISSYTAGTAVPGGDFDVADITFVSPADGASVTLPADFCWTLRSTTSDNYRLLFYNPVAEELAATGYLGYVNCETITGLPSDWLSGETYAWWVRVYQGADPDATPYNYGDAFGERDVVIRYGAPAEGRENGNLTYFGPGPR